MSEIVESLWGKVALERSNQAQPRGWLDSDIIQKYYVNPLTKSGDRFRIEALIERLQIPNDGRWLSIGCGSGSMELSLSQKGYFKLLDGFDIAPGAIEVGRNLAKEKGIANINFQVVDLEHYRIEEDKYDVILCAMGLHHIGRLEYVLEEFTRGLKPNGLIIIDEFIGPSQWQWSDKQLLAMNILLKAIPQKYLRDVITGHIKEYIDRPSLDFMNAVDPSESIRSFEIVPLFLQQFQLVERNDYGGCVLHKLLENIVSNFNINEPEDVAVIQLLCAAEQSLIQTGALTSDFTSAAVRNRKLSFRRSSAQFDAFPERNIVKGVYSNEITPRGQYFSWMSQSAEIVLQKPHNAREISLLISRPPIEGLAYIYVNDIQIGDIITKSNSKFGRWENISFKLPPDLNEQPTIRIDFDNPWKPSDLWSGSDERVLGIAISKIEYI